MAPFGYERVRAVHGRRGRPTGLGRGPRRQRPPGLTHSSALADAAVRELPDFVRGVPSRVDKRLDADNNQPLS